MNKKFKGLLKDTLIFALGSFGSKIILFLLVPLYTNYLSTEQYGSAEFVFTMSQLLYPVLSLCIYEGIVRIGLKSDTKKEDTLLAGLFVWVISTVVLLVFTPLWALYKAVNPWRWYLSIYTSLHILCEVELSYLKIKDKNKVFAISCIFQTITLALLNIYLLVFIKAGVTGYLLANSLSLLFQSIFIFVVGEVYKDISDAHLNLKLLKSILSYSTPLILNNISWWIIHSSDKIMIESMLTASSLGLYTVATKIPSLINVFINIFSQSWGLASIKEMEGSNDKSFYSSVFSYYTTIVIGFSILVIFICKPFMSIYVGKDFVSAWHYVPFLIVSAVFSSIAAYFASLMGALQITKQTMISTISGAIVNVFLNYVFIQVYDVWGAIIGTVAGYIVIASIRCWVTLKHIDLSLPASKTIMNLMIIMIQALFVSANFHIYLISIISFLMFVLINKRFFLQIIRTIRINMS